MSYAVTTEAERLCLMFERGELSLDEIVAEAVSDLVENSLRYLAFHDGSEWILPCPWASDVQAA